MTHWEPAQASAALPACCREAAALLSPEAALDTHLAEVEGVADGMLARLDELTATLRTVSDDVASQQAALEPAFRTILAGLARDFAYVDGVGDALVNLRVAVQRMEASITAGEAALWSKQRAEEVEAGRRAVRAMLTSLGGGTAVVRPSEDAQ